MSQETLSKVSDGGCGRERKSRAIPRRRLQALMNSGRFPLTFGKMNVSKPSTPQNKPKSAPPPPQIREGVWEMESHPSLKLPKPETQNPITQIALKKVNSIAITVNQTSENSTFLSREINGSSLAVIGNTESLAEGRMPGGSVGLSQPKHLANPPSSSYFSFRPVFFFLFF